MEQHWIITPCVTLLNTGSSETQCQAIAQRQAAPQRQAVPSDAHTQRCAYPALRTVSERGVRGAPPPENFFWVPFFRQKRTRAPKRERERGRERERRERGERERGDRETERRQTERQREERERDRERERQRERREKRERGLSNEYFIYEVERMNYHKKELYTKYTH